VSPASLGTWSGSTASFRWPVVRTARPGRKAGRCRSTLRRGTWPYTAFSSGRSGTNEIWLADPAGSNALQLTSMHVRSANSPRWSPDGRLIAFDANVEDHYEVYVISTAGGKPRRLISSPANNYAPSFSRDGKWNYFGSNRTGEDQIFRMPAAGGEPIQVCFPR
jgi:Tol biopolymer transport system component